MKVLKHCCITTNSSEKSSIERSNLKYTNLNDIYLLLKWCILRTTRFICVLNEGLKKQPQIWEILGNPVVTNPSAFSLPKAVRSHKTCDLSK